MNCLLEPRINVKDTLVFLEFSSLFLFIIKHSFVFNNYWHIKYSIKLCEKLITLIMKVDIHSNAHYSRVKTKKMNTNI